MIQYPHIKRLVDHFWERGIFALDASVFHPEDAENCKFIDLTTHRGNKIFCELIATGPRASPSELADFLGLS